VDHHRLGAEVREGVEVADRGAGLERGRRAPGRLLQAAGADQQHHVEDLDDVEDAEAPDRVGVLAEVLQRAPGARIAEVEQVDGAPAQTHERQHRQARARRHADQLLGHAQAGVDVLGDEQRVVPERQRLGERPGVAGAAGALDGVVHRFHRLAVVYAFRRQAAPQPAAQRRTRRRGARPGPPLQAANRAGSTGRRRS